MLRSPWSVAGGVVLALLFTASAQALSNDNPLMSSSPSASLLGPPRPIPAPPPIAQPAGPEKLTLTDDGLARMTIPVMIDGKGPFPFIVDTGADRTAISGELAAELKLPSGPNVRLHESGGVEDVATVVIDRLDVGKRVVEGVNAPVLSAHNIGAMGILGIDSLHDQHVTLDFREQKLLSSASRIEAFDPDTIVVRGKSRFGQLILVDATVRGIPVYVILDSGAQNTVGNLALRKLLTYGVLHHDHPGTEVISVTGRETPAEFEDVSEMRIGGLTIRNVPLAFAELHTFAKFDLVDRPAMLLGMDVLGQCEKVTVDFKRREATFTVRGGA